MEAKHTPGPLQVHLIDECHQGNQYNISNEDDRLLLEGDWHDRYVLFGGYFGSYGPHMFAAAPELLKAAQEMVRAEMFLSDHPQRQAAYDAARAAINQATKQGE